MFRSTRVLIPLAVLGGLSITGGIAWFTGLIQAGWNLISGWYHSIADFLSQPWGLDQLAVGLGVPLAAILVIVMALALLFDP